MKKSDSRSLAEVHSSVNTSNIPSRYKKLLAFMGPAYLVSVGYMDPGNWATDIAGGSQFGYRLIWVLLMSNLVAVLLQGFSARLGIVRGLDLAQASRATYPKAVNFSLYILAEIAIAACDLAEILGMAIGLNLLFGFPLLWGVCFSVLDTFLLLFLMNLGIKKIEAFIISLVAIIAVCFFIEMFLVKPDMLEVAKGFIPSLPNSAALYIAIGIIGATVMPHNLYLHSSLVQTRKFERNAKDIKQAIKYNIVDSVIALNFAFFVNAGILILAGTVFYKSGNFDITEIQDAYKMLEPLVGSHIAPILFAVALIAAGQSSTITGTLAGQIVMEGYLNLRIQPWIRRLLTRLVAIVPAFLTILIYGESSTGELLILSQVILSLQLGFAIIPLLHFVSDKEWMKEHAIGMWAKIGGWLSAIIIIGLNGKLVYDSLLDWIGDKPITVWQFGVVIVAVAAVFLLIYITLFPYLSQRLESPKVMHNPILDFVVQGKKSYKRIAMTVDFSSSDNIAISHALSHGDEDSEYLIVHVLESAGAFVENQNIDDAEAKHDQELLEAYQQQLERLGFKVSVILGYGNPKKQIPLLVTNFDSDLLVMAAHGHTGVKDFLLGTTLDAVRHKVEIPVLIVSA